jgi:hypothetical protein
MDPEPRGFRSILLLTAVVVILSGIGGFLLWWFAFHHAPAGGADGSAGGAGGGTLRPVAFPPTTSEPDRQRIDAAVERLLALPPDSRQVEPNQALFGIGEPAVPRLLDALHRLNETDGFRSQDTRDKAARVSRVLRRIAKAERFAAATPPAVRARSEPSDALDEARAWFRWWEVVKPPGAE